MSATWWIWGAFVTAMGACIGSFLNVVAYRLPMGQSVVNPPSRCPNCEHRLAWYDNLPVVGWIMLRGRCRYCSKSIAPRYPLVEAVTAILFAIAFFVWYHSGLHPAFVLMDPLHVAPAFAVLLLLIAALVVSAVIDAEWFIIPPVIPYVVFFASLVILPAAAAVNPDMVVRIDLPPVQVGQQFVPPALRREAMQPIALRRLASVEGAIELGGEGPVWLHAAPHAGGRLASAAMGGTLALMLALFLLHKKILPRSFDEASAPEEELVRDPAGPRQLPLLLAPIGGAVAAGLWLDQSWAGAWNAIEPLGIFLTTLLAAYVVVAASVLWMGVATGRSEDGSEDLPEHLFTPHPHPRREAQKELLFVLMPGVGAVIGAWMIHTQAVAWIESQAWAMTLGGVLAGALAGAAISWGARIGGTLLFNKEAMGLGDVHLMIGVGAAAGWRVAVMGFFLAAAVGLAHTLLTAGLGRWMNLQGRHIPFGPHLAAGCLVALILREPMAAYFALILGY